MLEGLKIFPEDFFDDPSCQVMVHIPEFLSVLVPLTNVRQERVGLGGMGLAEI